MFCWLGLSVSSNINVHEQNCLCHLSQNVSHFIYQSNSVLQSCNLKFTENKSVYKLFTYLFSGLCELICLSIGTFNRIHYIILSVLSQQHTVGVCIHWYSCVFFKGMTEWESLLNCREHFANELEKTQPSFYCPLLNMPQSGKFKQALLACFY